MKYFHFFLISIFSLFFSCKSGDDVGVFPNSITFNSEDVQHLHLTGGRQLEISPALRVDNLELYDSTLIITGQSVANEFNIHVHNAVTGENLNSFARLGRGPNEFLYIPSVRVLENRREIYFFDPSTNIGVIYSLDSLLSELIIPSEIVPLENTAYRMHLRIDSTNFLCDPRGNNSIGIETNYMLFSIYDHARDTFFNRVSLPPLENIDSVINHIHVTSIFGTSPDHFTYNESTGYIVVPYVRTDLIEVYDYNDAMRRVVRVHGPDRFFPYFEFTNPVTSLAELVNPDQKKQTWPVARDPSDHIIFPYGVSRIGYSRARSFEDGFYVVYDGKPIPERGADLAKYSSRDLYFFRYEGTPVRRYTFDIPFRGRYTVDHQRGVIYILGLDGEIYAYDIPPYEEGV